MVYHEEPIWRAGRIVGSITSGAYGHSIGASLSMGYLNCESGVDAAFLNAEPLEVEIAWKRYPIRADVAAWNALGLNWTPSKGDGDEEEPIQRGADHRGAEGEPGGGSDAGALPQARDQRLRSLEDENRKLKKLLAESMLDVATLRALRPVCRDLLDYLQARRTH
jgi:hypothetical protein